MTFPHLKNVNTGSAWVTCGKPNSHSRVGEKKKKHLNIGARGGTGAEAFGFDDRFKSSHHLVS